MTTGNGVPMKPERYILRTVMHESLLYAAELEGVRVPELAAEPEVLGKYLTSLRETFERFAQTLALVDEKLFPQESGDSNE